MKCLSQTCVPAWPVATVCHFHPSYWWPEARDLFFYCPSLFGVKRVKEIFFFFFWHAKQPLLGMVPLVCSIWHQHFYGTFHPTGAQTFCDRESMYACIFYLETFAFVMRTNQQLFSSFVNAFSDFKEMNLSKGSLKPLSHFMTLRGACGKAPQDVNDKKTDCPSFLHLK